MKKGLILLLFVAINVHASGKNIGFLMNQKYVCVHEGAITEDKIVPLLSKEEAFKYPMRIVIDGNNLLQTDGPIKNLEHIEKTTYGNSDYKVLLLVKNDYRFILFTSKDMGNTPILSSCVETDDWTITK